MKSRLPSFACLFASMIATCPGASAQLPTPRGAPSASPAAANDSISGDLVLRRVLATVDAQTSIAARLRYEVHLKGRTALGSGLYLQQGRGPERQFRLDLNLNTPPITSRVQHICDGSTLWIVEDLAGQNHLAQVDVARLRRARPKSPAGTGHLHGWLTLGGLPKLLSGLDAAFRFGPVRESQLDEVRVGTLTGQWETGRLANLLPKQTEAIEAGQPVDFSKLSAQLPTHVVLHVGRNDFFPYRIEYWRSEKGDPGGAPGSRGELLVLMEFYEVRAGTPIDPASFAFSPPDGSKPQNRTSEFLERFGLEDAAPAGAKRKSAVNR
jgi:hypothetical protein